MTARQRVARAALQKARNVRRALIAKRFGMKHARTIADEAHRAGLLPSLAFALVEQESTDGSNVFGHDPTIFVGAGQVTKEKYLAYKWRRGRHGEGGMQGVGPVQLTYYSIQDEADRLGGCHKVRYSLRVGFRDLAHLIRLFGVRKALAVYNGGEGNPNYAYADSVLALDKKWHARFNPRKKR